MASQQMQNGGESEAPFYCIADLFIFKPCFGIRLDIAVKIIAVINMLLGAFVGFLALFGLLFFCLRTQDMLHMLRNNAYEPLILLARLGPVVLASLLFLLLVVAIVLYFIGLLLWVGAKEYCYDKISRWWNISLTLVSINVLANFIFWIMSSSKQLGFTILQVLDAIVLFYILWVVNCFRSRVQPPRDEEIAAYNSDFF